MLISSSSIAEGNVAAEQKNARPTLKKASVLRYLSQFFFSGGESIRGGKETSR